MVTAPSILGEQNTVFIHPKGYIEVMTIGVQSPATVKAMGDEIVRLAQPLIANHQRVLILDNLTKMALHQPSAVSKAVAAEAKRLDFYKVAMLGGPNRLLKYGANFMIQAIGKGSKIRYFTDRNQAEAWLNRR